MGRATKKPTTASKPEPTTEEPTTHVARKRETRPTTYREQLLASREQFLFFQGEAQEASQFTSVIKAQENIKSIDQEINKLDAMDKAALEPVSGLASKKATLRAIRMNREAALADKSYTASVNLLKQEQDLVLSIAADELSSDIVLTEEELIDGLAETIGGFSDIVYQKLLAKIRR